MTEQELKKQVVDYLNYRKDLYFFKSSSGLIKTEQGRFFRTGRVGCPDITILYKGKFIACELKTKTGKQSQGQKEAEEQIKKCGGIYLIVRDLDDLIKVL